MTYQGGKPETNLDTENDDDLDRTRNNEQTGKNRIFTQPSKDGCSNSD